MLQNYLISHARTFAPIAVGAVLAWLAVRFGLEVDGEAQAGLTVLVTGLIQAGYYALARALEQRWPLLGVLLGVPAKPRYPDIAHPSKEF